MNHEYGNQDIMNLRTSTTGNFRIIAIGTCFLAFAIVWTLRSSSEPGGILHGITIWTRPYTNALLRPGASMANASDNDTCDIHDPYEDPLPAVRSEFGAIATIVYGWPSTGGVWVHEDCYGVELDFLGLSRFEVAATERFSKEEDEFCQRLEWIGGHFYESEYAYNKNNSRKPEFQVWYGWPGAVPNGGVWALRTSSSDAAEIGVSRIRNALTMEERCKAIQMLGGTFHKTWEEAAKVQGLVVQ